MCLQNILQLLNGLLVHGRLLREPFVRFLLDPRECYSVGYAFLNSLHLRVDHLHLDLLGRQMVLIHNFFMACRQS